MHRLGPVLVLLALVLTGSASVAGAADDLTAHECRHKWANIAQTHGENDNPGGSTTVLNDRWHATYDKAHRRARRAGPDGCGDRLRTYDRRWDGLESLQYDLHVFDMPHLLFFAEGDRRHWKGLQHEYGRSGELPEDLKVAFRTARREAPLAAADLAPTLAGAGGVDVADGRARRAFTADVATVAAQSSHLAACRAALDLIDEAELDEE
ncbi:MAG: hypothetical protein ACR2JD_01490 [Nocardioides sp.]